MAPDTAPNGDQDRITTTAAPDVTPGGEGRYVRPGNVTPPDTAAPRCAECGAALTSWGEHHPMRYCLLIQAGVTEPADAETLLREAGLIRD